MTEAAWNVLACFGALAVALWIIQELMFQVADRKDKPRKRD